MHLVLWLAPRRTRVAVGPVQGTWTSRGGIECASEQRRDGQL